MAFRRREKQHVDDTLKVIDEAEANRRRLIELAARLCVYVEDLRDLTNQVRRQQEKGASGG